MLNGHRAEYEDDWKKAGEIYDQVLDNDPTHVVRNKQKKSRWRWDRLRDKERQSEREHIYIKHNRVEREWSRTCQNFVGRREERCECFIYWREKRGEMPFLSTFLHCFIVKLFSHVALIGSTKAQSVYWDLAKSHEIGDFTSLRPSRYVAEWCEWMATTSTAVHPGAKVLVLLYYFSFGRGA